MPKPSVETPKITAERRVVVKDRVELPRSTWRGSRRRSTSRVTPTPTSRQRVLGGGKSSRLYKTLVYDKQIAQDVSARSSTR